MKAVVVILLAILLVGSLLVIAAETRTSQARIYHPPHSSQFGKLALSDPGPSLSSHDFLKHYADSNTDFAHILIPQPGQHTHDEWEMSTASQIKFGWINERDCHITCIMLSIATRVNDLPNKVSCLIAVESKSQFGIHV